MRSGATQKEIGRVQEKGKTEAGGGWCEAKSSALCDAGEQFKVYKGPIRMLGERNDGDARNHAGIWN